VASEGKNGKSGKEIREGGGGRGGGLTLYIVLEDSSFGGKWKFLCSRWLLSVQNNDNEHKIMVYLRYFQYFHLRPLLF